MTNRKKEAEDVWHSRLPDLQVEVAHELQTSINTIDEEEITMIQNGLNKRPRKRLGFKKTSEVVHRYLKRVALRT